MTTTITTEPPTPDDPAEIAAMIPTGADRIEDEEGRGLFERLTDKHGYEKGSQLWSEALAIYEAGGRVEQETEEFALVLLELQAAAAHALSSIKALTTGDSKSRTYDGQIGKDLTTLIERIGLQVRCAIALNPTSLAPAAAAEFLRTVGLDDSEELPDEDDFYDDASERGPQHAEHIESDAERGICRRCGVSILDGYCTNPETEQ